MSRLFSVLTMVAVLPLTLLTVASCSATGGDTATSTEDTLQAQATTTDNISPAPNPAFDPLLPTLQQMTTAPIMLPASLPSEIKSVAIEQDPNENPYTTGGDKYTILFSHSDQDPNQIVRPYVHYMTAERLTASPANASPLDPTNGLGTPPHQLGNVALPDGTVADLKQLEPPSGANYGPFTVGTFEEEGERYTVMIENDSPNGDSTREILSTMVRVPRA